MEKHFTHVVTFYGIKCFWAEESHTVLPIGIMGRYLFFVAVRFHMAMTAIAQALAPGFDGGFPFKVLGRINGWIKE